MQRLGCLQAENLLIIGVDAVGSLVCLKLKPLDPLGVPRSLGEGKLLNLLIQIVEFLLLGIDEVNLLLVLLDLVPLDIILCQALKDVSQKGAIGNGLGVTVLVQNLSRATAGEFELLVQESKGLFVSCTVGEEQMLGESLVVFLFIPKCL